MIPKVPADMELHAYPSAPLPAKSRSEPLPHAINASQHSHPLRHQWLFIICCFVDQTGPSQTNRYKYTYFVNLINEKAHHGLLSPQSNPEMQTQK